jgi:hypothetical protein
LKDFLMKTLTLILTGSAVLLSIPALAAMKHGGTGHHGGPGRAMMMGMDPAKPVARAEIESMVKAHFAKIDTNKDGFLIKDEVAAAHQAMMAERRDADFKDMDTDGNGAIARAEYDAQLAAHHPDKAAEGHQGMGLDHKDMGHGRERAGTGGIAERMFLRADVDKDGRVSLAEALAKPLQHFDQSDSNKDGVLTPAERESELQAMKAKRRSAAD